MVILCFYRYMIHVYSFIMFLRCVYTMFIPTITQWTCHLPHPAPLRWWAIVISSPSDAGGNDMFQGRGQLRLPCVVDLPRCPDVPSPRGPMPWEPRKSWWLMDDVTWVHWVCRFSILWVNWANWLLGYNSVKYIKHDWVILNPYVNPLYKYYY